MFSELSSCRKKFRQPTINKLLNFSIVLKSNSFIEMKALYTSATVIYQHFCKTKIVISNVIFLELRV